MDSPFSTVVLVLGLFLGIFAGIAFAVARRAWVDYRTTRASVPGLRRKAWTLIRIATTRSGIALLLCIAAVGWAAIGGR